MPPKEATSERDDADGASSTAKVDVGGVVVTVTVEAQPNSRLRRQGQDLGRLARALFRERRRRDEQFASSIFGEPSWDILLHLYSSSAEGHPVSISNACAAASVPATTALRYIKKLTSSGYVVRERVNKGRSSVLKLTDRAHGEMTRLLTGLAATKL